ncbi:MULTISPECIES: hypothetical protein [Mesorhizobium]|uniref:Uncharacterized protein n=2 Tax=Mesorhizobium TaxID=68287 RepID=A0A1A5HVK3_RHILI|nr:MULTISPECIES: hypothetical protein [Mesorhizobium]MBE1711167.1 hypothetical protein [Mesorhizobium japonicum]MBE1714660.1 hypothetical protein [Mesorhizobium japonicum]MUT22271.1 hypothetical protein [Mesorhizobium japonicum]MUT28308.1 hypothetical protein [Mesorhizobium japonicum]OBP70989.1 hypothetical protein BAE41_19375 [Mesorhizobium loti]
MDNDTLLTSSTAAGHIDTKGQDFKELGLREIVVIGDQNYPWTLICLGGHFLKLLKDDHSLWHVVFDTDFPQSFGAFTSKVQALRALRDYADKNGEELQIEYLSDDGSFHLRENPKAI